MNASSLQTNPPRLPGTAPIPQSAVTPSMTAWAIAVLHDPEHFPMHAWDVRTFGTSMYLARVEWHSYIGRTGQVLAPGQYIRGVTLYLVTDVTQIPASPTLPPPVPIPAGAIEGLDVSHYQGVIDWGKVAAAGIRFAILKATEGLTGSDDRYASNAAASKAAGVVRGAYHFVHPNVSGAAQAQHFLAQIGLQQDLELPFGIDIEETDGQSAVTIAQDLLDFVNVVASSCPGGKPLLYTSPGWWLGHVAQNGFSATLQAIASKTILWNAHWDTTDPGTIHGWVVPTVWQYSARGQIPGIVGNVDRDRFLGDEDAFQVWLHPGT